MFYSTFLFVFIAIFLIFIVNKIIYTLNCWPQKYGDHVEYGYYIFGRTKHFVNKSQFCVQI